MAHRLATAASAAVAPPSPSDANGPSAWTTLAVVSAGLFLAVLSTTVVALALPTMGRDLGAGPSALEWVVDAYVVVYASLLVAAGRLGDHLGRKGLFLSGIALFGLGSLLSGLAPAIGVLLAGRVLQGLGPALAVPGSLTIVRAVFTDPRRRALAIGLWSMSSGLALAAGPPVGGLLVASLGWRAVFWVNAPLAAILLVVGAQRLPRLPRPQRPGHFDWAATLLITLALGALALGAIEGQGSGWTNGVVVGAFMVGGLTLGGFVVTERRRADPLVDLSLFRSYAFTLANLAAFVVFFAFVGALVYLSAYFQQVQGHGPVTAGVDLVAIGVAYAGTTVVSGRLVGRIGERWPLLVGLVVAGAATLGLLRLGPATGIGAIWWIFALLGAGIGLCGTPMSTIAMSAVSAERAGMASAVVNAVRQVGQVFGVAVLGALIYAHFPGASGTTRALGPEEQTLFVTGLHHALWVCGLLLLGAAGLSLGLFARLGHGPKHTQHQPPSREREAHDA